MIRLFVIQAICLLGLGAVPAVCQTSPMAQSDPFEVVSRCEVPEEERVTQVSPPTTILKEFQQCVSRYSSAPATKQSVGWIAIWYKAISCLHYCNAPGMRKVAHINLWYGLRYIAATSLPQGSQVDRACRRVQLSLVTAIDEAMNVLAEKRVDSEKLEFCKTEKALEESEANLLFLEEKSKEITEQLEQSKRDRP